MVISDENAFVTSMILIVHTSTYNIKGPKFPSETADNLLTMTSFQQTMEQDTIHISKRNGHIVRDDWTKKD